MAASFATIASSAVAFTGLSKRNVDDETLMIIDTTLAKVESDYFLLLFLCLQALLVVDYIEGGGDQGDNYKNGEFHLFPLGWALTFLLTFFAALEKKKKRALCSMIEPIYYF